MTALTSAHHTLPARTTSSGHRHSILWCCSEPALLCNAIQSGAAAQICIEAVFVSHTQLIDAEQLNCRTASCACCMLALRSALHPLLCQLQQCCPFLLLCLQPAQLLFLFGVLCWQLCDCYVRCLLHELVMRS